MAGRMDPKLRERLLAKGTLAQYLARRDALKIQNIKPKERTQILAAEFDGGDTGTPPTAPAEAHVQDSRRDVLAKILSPGPETGDRRWSPMAAFGGRKADGSTVIEWVFNHMYITDVTAEMAPSAGAWGYLQECRKNIDVRQDFFKNVWPKLLPTKSQIENLSKLRDDGSAITDLIDRAAAAVRQPPVLPQGSEGLAGQPAVPAPAG